MSQRHVVKSEYVITAQGSYTVSLGTFSFNSQSRQRDRENPVYDIRVIPLGRGFDEHVYEYSGEENNLEDCLREFPETVQMVSMELDPDNSVIVKEG